MKCAPLAVTALLMAASAAAQTPSHLQADLQRIRSLAHVTPLAEVPPAFHRTPPPPLPLPARDDWFGFDKVQHFTFGFLFTLGGQYVLVNKADASEGRALPLSAGFSAGVGVAKELYDSRPGGTGFSYKDLLWDAAGIAAASLLIAL